MYRTKFWRTIPRPLYPEPSVLCSGNFPSQMDSSSSNSLILKFVSEDPYLQDFTFCIFWYFWDHTIIFCWNFDWDPKCILGPLLVRCAPKKIMCCFIGLLGTDSPIRWVTLLLYIAKVLLLYRCSVAFISLLFHMKQEEKLS